MLTDHVPAQFIIYPGQYHTLTRPRLQDRAERMAASYTQYLISSAR
jgi:hypothetical protein